MCSPYSPVSGELWYVLAYLTKTILIWYVPVACELALIGIPSAQGHAKISLSELLNLGRFAFATSMAVNAFVTILISSRIWVLSKHFARLHQRTDKTYDIVVAMLLESGLIIFVAQLCWLVLFSLNSPGFYLVSGAVTQIYVSCL